MQQLDLNSFQHAFWAALWAPEPLANAAAGLQTRPDWQTQPGWRVYRNTVLKGCVDALQANFPAVQTLIGEACFSACAIEYVHAQPPSDSRLLHYGEGFADFLAQCEAVRGLPYLPGVARLDRLWSQSHAAADAPHLWPENLQALAVTDLAERRLHLHPATRWAWFAELPIGSLWRAAREHWDDPNPPHWQGDGLLFARAATGAVQWQPLSASGAALLAACAQGHSLGVAMAAALEVQPDTHHSPDPHPAQTLHTLLSLGAFCQPPNTKPCT